MESYKLAEAYMEEFHKNPVATTLWTVVAVLSITAIVIYSRWKERKKKQREKYW